MFYLVAVQHQRLLFLKTGIPRSMGPARGPSSPENMLTPYSPRSYISGGAPFSIFKILLLRWYVISYLLILHYRFRLIFFFLDISHEYIPQILCSLVNIPSLYNLYFINFNRKVILFTFYIFNLLIDIRKIISSNTCRILFFFLTNQIYRSNYLLLPRIRFIHPIFPHFSLS